MMDKRVLDRARHIVNVRENWEPLVDLLNERLSFLRISLEKAVDLHQIYRLQGEISNTRWLLSLREKVNG